MSIDHGKLLVACRRKLEAYRDAYGLEYVGGQELSSLLADIDRALAQPAEAATQRCTDANNCKRCSTDADTPHSGIVPPPDEAVEAGGAKAWEMVEKLQAALNYWLPTMAQAPAFEERIGNDACLLMGYTGSGLDAPTYHDTISQPAEAVEGGMRDAYEGAREDLLDWKGRAQRAEARLRSLGWVGIEANEPPTDAAQGAVAMIVRDCCELDPADPDHPDTVSVSVADLRRIVERYTHPQAAPSPSTAAVCDPESVETLRHMTGYEWLADDQVDALNEAIDCLGATTNRCSGIAGRWIDGLWVIDIATDSGIRLEVVKYDDDLKQRIKPSTSAERASELQAAPAQGGLALPDSRLDAALDLLCGLTGEHRQRITDDVRMDHLCDTARQIAALAAPAQGDGKDCTCQKYEGRDCRRCFNPPYPDGNNPPPLWGTKHWQGSILQMVGEMRNFADVADRCELTEGNAPAVIRLWADRLAAAPSQEGE